ncbi:GNAT family N-acetyltransferase [Alkalihalobacillus sp. MEB130]|uniref:GNAT family N-acetyltransferase n=1 Tax=Alkalihalobacillus sp. MEB130 TaxID=2976704 RepID=UPI0028DE741F|nr:GNAT family N-acetyltransferase [Alkalihalobacillus sp. MEB130]MDT8861253.1 GNAT family N-acetyltransferase [Alkalihalobacillus sp. MEB130]
MFGNTMIRKANNGDIVDIQKLAKETWNHTYEGLIPIDVQNKFIESAYSDERMELRIKKSLFLVATMNKEVIGFANFFSNELEATLGAMYICPSKQGKGVGSQLLTTGMKELNNIENIYVEVEKGNEVGEAFYEARGFRLIDEYVEDFYGHMLQTKRLVLKV